MYVDATQIMLMQIEQLFRWRGAWMTKQKRGQDIESITRAGHLHNVNNLFQAAPDKYDASTQDMNI